MIASLHHRVCTPTGWALIGCLIVVTAGFRAAGGTERQHDFSHDPIVGRWRCVDDPPHRVVQSIAYSPSDHGRTLLETSAFRLGSAYGVRRSRIAFDGQRYTWRVVEDPGLVFASSTWFRSGRLQLAATDGSARLIFVFRNYDALNVTYRPVGPHHRGWPSVSRCHRVPTGAAPLT
ncbi:MAG: hypothetical protein ABI202_04030 [Candidatus Baltobacteraceae bacterium]